MKTLNLLLTITFINLFFFACQKDDALIKCYQQVIVSTVEYNNAPNDPLEINKLEIIDDCLTINFSAGGCNGDSWELKLIASEGALYSQPPQRNVRLSLKNNEACEKYITKEITFNIAELQEDGNQIMLNITNSGEQISYEYSK